MLLPWVVFGFEPPSAEAGEGVGGPTFRSILPTEHPLDRELFRCVCALRSRGVSEDAIDRFAAALREEAEPGRTGPSRGHLSPRARRTLRQEVVEADRSPFVERSGRDGLFVVHRPSEVALRDGGIGGLREGLGFHGGTLLRELADRTNRRFRTSGFQSDPATWFYKAYPPALGAARRVGGAAEREWGNARLLRTLGIRTAEPGAFGEARRRGPVRGASFVVTRAVEGAVPLDDWIRGLADPEGTSPAEVSSQARRRAVREVARLVATVHGAGAYHKDFYACHLLVRPSGVGPAFELRCTLIDLERMRFRVRPFRRWFVKDLAALEHSIPGGVTRADRIRFLREYLQERTGERPRRGTVRGWIRRVRHKAARIAGHRPKR